MKIQWYPGHMTKAMRAIQEDIKIIDIIIEMRDARIPLASANPDIAVLGQGKARIIILNKSDLAEEKVNKAWESYIKKQGYSCIFADSRQKGVVRRLIGLLDKASEAKREKDLKRGIKNRPVRTIVLGIPNVGKSTLINSIAGKSSAKTGNKPGVTKGNQWIKLNKQIELLDTPGILMPKIENEEMAVKLAFIGTVNDLVFDSNELALELLNYLVSNHATTLYERYDMGNLNKKSDMHKYLEHIAKVRGCLKKGAEYDYEKASNLLISDFRSGRLGRISLEMPPALPEV